jgi:hypothetical protein
MRYLIVVIIVILLIPSLAFAGKAGRLKSTGKLLDYYEHTDIKTIIDNAVRVGYDKNEIEVIEIKWEDYYKQKIRPQNDTRKASLKSKRAKAILKLQALGFTQEEIEGLLDR